MSLPPTSLLSVRGLTVTIGDRTVVEGIDLEVAPGECLAIVGASGAGKSLSALSLLGLAPHTARVSADELRLAPTSEGSGEILLTGVLSGASRERVWRGIRGNRIALVSQDALVALDPLRRVGAEVAEPLEIHERISGVERVERVHTLLTQVAVPDPHARARQRSGELSGGLRQRALIASALAGSPDVLIADEPTTALDATVRMRVLDLLRDIVDTGTSLILVSHDMAAVARVADRIAVMDAGRIVEVGTADEILRAPQHSVTQALVAAAEPGEPRPNRPDTDIVLTGDHLTRSYPGSGDQPQGLFDVSLALKRGRTLGIVGESGAGKTTLARLLLGLESADSGDVRLAGESWNPLPERERRGRRRQIQLVPQNPAAAFDPRWSIGRGLREALAIAGVHDRARVGELLELVELDPALATRRPHELSGGQRQRAALARALATGAGILILDEPLSALDVAVQRKVLTLLERLQDELGLAIALISHDLAVVRRLADDIVVLRDGHAVEQGTAASVLGNPQHPFTRELIAASTLPV